MNISLIRKTNLINKTLYLVIHKTDPSYGYGFKVKSSIDYAYLINLNQFIVKFYYEYNETTIVVF